MNLGELAVHYRTVTWVFTLVLLVLGYRSYQNLPRLEDPDFAIKEAVVVTTYPGASPTEVEGEVSDRIERAVQKLGQVRRVESYSSRGLSVVKVIVKDEYDKDALPAVWEELRRKINDVQIELPPGAGPSRVNDDFGDVYGIYYALVGPDFTYAELAEVAELLQRELNLVRDVKSVVLFGDQQETIFVEIPKARVQALRITLADVFQSLQAKNLPATSGHISIGPERVAISPSGLFISEEEFGDLLIGSREGRLIRLGDIATISRGYEDPPSPMLRVDSRPAIGIAISTVLGGNVVTMGEAVEQRLAELQTQIPVGMELEVIALQSETVVEAINGFVVSLVQAVTIVVITLLVLLGLRSGLIIGFVTILTMSATFVVMDLYDITLERISLGALVIALGLMTDNAIVLLDAVKLRLDRGEERMAAIKQVVAQNTAPLLAATAVGILAFASIGTMNNNTGEYTRALYLVVLISLSISWLTAVTVTPVLIHTFLKPAPERKDAGRPWFLTAYARLLSRGIRYRWIVLGAVVGLFLISLYAFGFVKRVFLPPSTSEIFLVEAYFREGTDIRATERNVAEIEGYLVEQNGVRQVATAIGSGHPRYLLIYGALPDVGSHYSASLVSVDDYQLIGELAHTAQNDLQALFPDAVIRVKQYMQGQSTSGGEIQLRIYGPDPVELRRMAEAAKAVIRADPDVKAVRDGWGDYVKVLQPILAEDRARRLGIDRRQLAVALQAGTSGTVAGLYREGTELIPIVTRPPQNERNTVEDMIDIPVRSPVSGENIPMLQLIEGAETVNEPARLSRFDRRPMIMVHADPQRGLTFELLDRVKADVEKALEVDVAAYLGLSDFDGSRHDADTIRIRPDDLIPIQGKPDYFIAWGGTAERSAESNQKLGASIPIFFGLMVLVVIVLFNGLRQPLVIWLTVPLSIIGVTWGLLLTNQPFGFMSLLGVMSLAGMLIKNAIVLVEEIDTKIASGSPRFDAVIESGIARLRPVILTAITTMLGMLPLLKDPFFVSMAVTIIFGLGVATVLTLFVVPVLYAAFFRIDPSEGEVHHRVAVDQQHIGDAL